MQLSVKLIVFLLFSVKLCAQGLEVRTRIDIGELKMTFPSIYFKHNSTDYAEMPYTVDSCLKHIATHIKDVTGKPIWRDSLETEQLTNERIKKIRSDLGKYTSSKLGIHSMKQAQKISRRTIKLGTDPEQTDYLLSLNSVFDIAKTRFPKTYSNNHGLWIFGTCYKCVLGNIFIHGSWLNKGGREHCRMDRKLTKNSVKQ